MSQKSNGDAIVPVPSTEKPAREPLPKGVAYDPTFKPKGDMFSHSHTLRDSESDTPSEKR